MSKSHYCLGVFYRIWSRNEIGPPLEAEARKSIRQNDLLESVVAFQAIIGFNQLSDGSWQCGKRCCFASLRQEVQLEEPNP
jgi:hypothetical protein